MLPAFLIAKYLMLYGNNFSAGYAMAIGLFRLAFLVMLERTLTGFMKAAFQTSILRQPKLDMAIKLLGLLLVIEPFLPAPFTAGLSCLALAVLLLLSASCSGSRNWPSSASTSASCMSATWPSSANC